MKKSIHYIYLFAFALILGSACKKSSLVKYDQPDMLYIYKDFNSATRDSTTYSFAIQSASKQYDTVWVPVRIMGVAKDYDREVSLAAVDSLSTAVEGTDYEFVKAIVPAGTYATQLPVKVLRSTSMKDHELRLTIEIKASKDFQPGISNSAAISTSTPGADTRYLIKINDFLTKPDNWDTRLKYYFGTYSQVKYAFIIQATGRAVFPSSGPDALPFSQFPYYQQVCKKALAEYEALNGPLMDEFGNRVTF
jgi:hypothetical protein